jgi:hypothetical protein
MLKLHKRWASADYGSLLHACDGLQVVGLSAELRSKEPYNISDTSSYSAKQPMDALAGFDPANTSNTLDLVAIRPPAMYGSSFPKLPATRDLERGNDTSTSAAKRLCTGHQLQ